MSVSFRNAATFFTALMTAVLAIGSASAEVVYGNLGPSGTDAISSSSGIGLTSSTWRAIGFTPGGSNLVLNTAAIGFNVSSAGSADVRLDLYSNNSGVPGTSLFNTTQTLAANTLNQLITFNVNQTLISGTTYWIVAQKTAGAGALTWRPAVGNPAPGTQNSSGWTNLGNSTGTTSTNSGTSWGSTGNGSSSSISLDAVPVPEPSVLAMLIGVAIPYAGWRIRRLRG